ncbi:phosphonate ABC transporter, permease protein PhnE [Spongiactinospora gelatinilytica]|uniref:Phosphonate ABC transporter, permease protein PhnE n=1 Tax=Spongiactinospora gelatinilytica TaxID=2666298 RepID=A0A2W2H7J8_9ACTN|nr:phosphonate ABC transporter, permease protein PhnE [Spongiactinospora gelatinilytica]PZG56661.1 phosphonate ABC transporter, permease protein PhnE [Spongiactinospora gelatinilytica]
MTASAELSATSSVAQTPRRRRPGRRRSATVGALLLALLGLGAASVIHLEINFATVVHGYANAIGFIDRIWPPELPSGEEVVQQTGFTLATTLLATLLSVAISFPLAVWAAANTTRGTGFRLGSRGVIVAARAVPDIVLAILFVRLFGLGVVPGILAMGLHSVGMVGKLYADALEQVSDKPREALRSIGASRGQQLSTAILPQALPAFIAIGLHRFDINLRHSALLGFVGVTGIGFEMSKAFGALQFGLGIVWAVILLLLCLLSELLSAVVRRSLMRMTTSAEQRALRRLPALLRRRSFYAPAPVQLSTLPTADRPIFPAWSFDRARRIVYAAIAVAVVLWSLLRSGALDLSLSGGLRGFLTTLGLFWPPGTAGVAPDLLRALFVTLEIGLASMLIGALLAIPLGSLAARNVSGHRMIHTTFRGIVLLVRGIPELVLAILFVVIIGLGPVAGALALAIGSIGLLGKLVADSLEEVDHGPLEALNAVGASRTQIYFTAILPQAARAIIGATLYQLDVNIRYATLLGLVGGGGVGFYLLQASHTREYEVITWIVLAIFAVVFALEIFAMTIRRLLA